MNNPPDHTRFGSFEGGRQSLLPSIILDVLFGAGVVLLLLSILYLFNRSAILPVHAAGIAAYYAVFALAVGIVTTSRCTSVYGTPLLYRYRKLSIYWFCLTAFFMIAGGLILSSLEWRLSSKWISWCLSAGESFVFLSCLGLLRGMSSAIRRQRKYPRLMGCSFLFIGDAEKTGHCINSFSGKEKRGLFLYSFVPSREEDADSRELQSIIETRFIEKAVFPGTGDFSRLIKQCKQQGIEVWTPASGQMRESSSGRFDIHRTTPKWSLIQFAFNRAASIVLILVSLPFWLIAAIGILLADKGPVFYQQMRSGLYGKHFGMWKFRTMYTNADKRLDEIKARYGNDMAGPIFKLKNDPRIFPLGKILRTFSIDELPQLINTLLGDMNIVGPRPLPVYETEAFDRIEQRKRLCVLPGLTCYWQIEGRSNITDFNELVALDYKYIDNRNVWLDIKLILKTIPAVLMARGAE